MLKPLGDRVILDQPQEEETTVGGIVLASNAQEKPSTANVVAVSDGRVLAVSYTHLTLPTTERV